MTTHHPHEKPDKRALRNTLIQEIMPLVRAEEDAHRVAYEVFSDDRAIAAWPDPQEREEIAWGIYRFCAWACGYDR